MKGAVWFVSSGPGYSRIGCPDLLRRRTAAQADRRSWVRSPGGSSEVRRAKSLDSGGWVVVARGVLRDAGRCRGTDS
jgi:hypothetical protein